MNPSVSLEQQWTNEVLYLHSLWHKVEPVSPPQFKPTGWAEPVKKTITELCSEDKEKVSAIQLQKKSVKACQEFFGRNCDSDDDGEEEEDDEEDGMEEDHDEESEEEFFLKVFKEDNELRNYYEKNFECGEFCCLVCGGIGEKVGKRFKNCVALIQHSNAISKTKRRNAHRAFGQAVCRVLGWNIERLPSIVLSLDEPIGRVLVKEGSQENNDCVEDSVTKADNVGGDQDANIHSKIVDSVDLEKVDEIDKKVVDSLEIDVEVKMGNVVR
ncbi:Zinc finger protein [Thalictrum thalictroides]|uniref:Zinc finger protein n=1 Tax=Thalictrum thalictroides TaxID=46969 RepID=A0A7J6X141_THATH|nr:Zinc finger protein [Thalictrum thalictroides]